MKPRETIERFDRFLAERQLEFSGVVVGGTALSLLGVISRETRDCDVIEPTLPDALLAAAARFAAAERAMDHDLADDWLNNGPASLTEVLPEDWQQRLRTLFTGEVIELQTLGRGDLLKAKLFALCDRGTDLQDCLALAPSETDLDGAQAWLREQDTNPDWPAHVDTVLTDLAKRIRDGL